MGLTLVRLFRRDGTIYGCELDAATKGTEQLSDGECIMLDEEVRTCTKSSS